MHSEGEHGFETLTAELVRESGEGLVEDEAIAELLDGTAWDHRQRHTRVGTAHVFTRPVTLLESARLEPEGYQNHRHTLGVCHPDRPDGEPLLTYLVLRNVHSSDLRALPEIESSLRGRGEVKREDFTAAEMQFVDRIWLPTADIEQASQKSRNAVCTGITNLLRRLRLANRAELLVLGLKEGFINPDLKEWRGSWKPLSALQSEVIRRAQFNVAEMADDLGVTPSSAYSAIGECYVKTGARTRGELILAALGNEGCRLSELRTPTMEPVFTNLEQRMLSLVDQPYNSLVEQVGAQKTTISNRYRRICEVLGLESRGELIVYAFREGYIENEVDKGLASVFSRRQREVVELLVYDNGRIGEELGISKAVVEHHFMEAKKRAGVYSRSELVAYGLRAGLIDPGAITPRAVRA